MSLYTSEGKSVQLGIGTISNKINLVKDVMKWTQEENATRGDKFLTVLKHQCESMGIGTLQSTLNDIAAWCKYRNELVHALMNKNLDSLNSELKMRAEEGMNLARDLDNEIRKLKKGNKIRRSMNLSIN